MGDVVAGVVADVVVSGVGGVVGCVVVCADDAVFVDVGGGTVVHVADVAHGIDAGGAGVGVAGGVCDVVISCMYDGDMGVYDVELFIGSGSDGDVYVGIGVYGVVAVVWYCCGWWCA